MATYYRQMDDVLTRLRSAAPSVFADLPVEVAYLFGSHARGEASQLSDVDVALLAPDVVPNERLNLSGLARKFSGVGVMRLSRAVGRVRER